LGLRTKNF